MGGFRFFNHMISSVCKNLYGIRSLSKPSHVVINSTTLPSVGISDVSKNLFKFRHDLSKPFMVCKSLQSVKVSHILHNPLCHFVGTRQYSVYRTVSHICQPLLKCLSCVTFFTGRFETLPYMNKTIYVFPFIDKIWGEIYFRSVLELLEAGEVLPQDHPQCVKIESIARKILEALQRETGGRHVLPNHQWLKEEEGGFRLVKKPRRNVESTAANLMGGIDWEIFVMDRPESAAGYINIGKIIFWRGFFDRYDTDQELAFVFATLVGHVVARHTQRSLTWFPFKLYHRIVDGYDPELYYRLSQYHEADYIAMQLSASAGYDPRTAVKTMEKAKEDIIDEIDIILTDKRIEFIAEPRVMQSAITRYEEKMKKGHVVN